MWGGPRWAVGLEVRFMGQLGAWSRAGVSGGDSVLLEYGQVPRSWVRVGLTLEKVGGRIK